jgi:hypothetical protein
MPHWVWTDIPALGSSTASVAFSPQALHRCPRLTAGRVPCWAPSGSDGVAARAQIMVYLSPGSSPAFLRRVSSLGGAAGLRARQAPASLIGVRLPAWRPDEAVVQR